MSTPHLGPITSRPGLPAPEPHRQAHDTLPGLPARDDPELAALMAAVRTLAREGLQETVRSLLRCALAAERTGDPAFMAALAADGLVTFRCRAARLAETTEGS